MAEIFDGAPVNMVSQGSAAASGDRLGRAVSGAKHTPGATSSSVAAQIHQISGTLLLVERLMVCLYYTALTSPAVMRDSALSGPSGNPNNPGLPPGGNPQQVRYLQAALDAEIKHAAMMSALGGRTPIDRFHLPASTFARMGTTVDRTSFLGVLEMLETVCIGAYGAAATEFLGLGRHDLAVKAAEIMGVESEHRTLGRVIAGIRPANSHTLETAPLAEVGEADAAIEPFVTGTRFLFAAGKTRVVTMPTRSQTARVIGKYGTRLVRSFL